MQIETAILINRLTRRQVNNVLKTQVDPHTAIQHVATSIVPPPQPGLILSFWISTFTFKFCFLPLPAIHSSILFKLHISLNVETEAVHFQAPWARVHFFTWRDLQVHPKLLFPPLFKFFLKRFCFFLPAWPVSYCWSQLEWTHWFKWVYKHIHVII